MSSSDNKRSISKRKRLHKKDIFWIIILILTGLLVLWGLLKEYKDDKDFKKHLENEQNHTF